MEKELEELEALDPPQGEEAKVGRILGAMEEGVNDAKEDPIDLVYKRSDPFQLARWLGTKYGLTVCALSSQVLIHPRAGDLGL